MADANFREKMMEKLLEVLAEKDTEAPNLDRVFQKMIDPPYRGKVLFNHVSKMSPEDFQPDTSHVELIRWFRSHPDKFAVFEGNNGRVAMFGVRVKKARICWKSNRQPSTCEDVDCDLFHICKKYVSGNCASANCRLDHHFQSEHSRRLLKRFSLDKFNDVDLMTIFRQSHLQTCYFYEQKGTCDHDDRCTRIHICANFVNGLCTEPCPKQRKHDFETVHSQRLLRVYDLHDRKLEDQLDQLLICDIFGQKTSPKKLQNDEMLRLIAENFPIFLDDDLESASDDDDDDDDHRPFSPIRGFNVRSKGLKKVPEATVLAPPEPNTAGLPQPKKGQQNAQKPAKCTKWEMELFGDWKPLGDIRSRRLETAYCDPKNDLEQIMLPDVDECSLFDTLIDVNLNDMTAALLEGEEKLNIRRVANADDTWLWYYETDDKNWDPYPEDDQLLMETALLVKEKRVFVGKGEIYRIKFSSLTQRNRETGKERRIRRRPIHIEH